MPESSPSAPCALSVYGGGGGVPLWQISHGRGSVWGQQLPAPSSAGAPGAGPLLPSRVRGQQWPSKEGALLGGLAVPLHIAQAG